MEKRYILRSAKEPAVINVMINGKGKPDAEEMMRVICEAIQKKNRQRHNAGGTRMAYRIELI